MTTVPWTDGRSVGRTDGRTVGRRSDRGVWKVEGKKTRKCKIRSTLCWLQSEGRFGFCVQLACWWSEEGEIDIVIAVVVSKGSRARLHGLVCRGDLFLSPLSLCLSLSRYLLVCTLFLLFSRSPIAGDPPLERRRRGTTTCETVIKEKSVLQEAQCPTGKASTISRKVRITRRNAVAKHSLCCRAFLSLSFLLFPPVLASRSLNRYVLTASHRTDEMYTDRHLFLPWLPSLMASASVRLYAAPCPHAISSEVLPALELYKSLAQ